MSARTHHHPHRVPTAEDVEVAAYAALLFTGAAVALVILTLLVLF
jgi:hypothetical protein